MNILYVNILFIFSILAKYCIVSWSEAELQSFVPMEVKNRMLTLPVKITICLPSSQKVGPSKVDESHIRRSVLRRRQSKPKREHSAIDGVHKSITLAPPTRRSADSEMRALSKSPSSSPSGSPRRKFNTGSFRRSKKADSNLKNKSDLLESLDLHNSELETNDSNSTMTINDATQPPPTPEESVSKIRSLKDTPGTSTPRTSRMTLKRSFARLRSLANTTGSQESSGGGGGVSVSTGVLPLIPTHVPPVPKSPPIAIPDGRFMDSLNLEFPLASDLSISDKNSKSRDSALSDSTTDTVSDTVDFDQVSGDRVSITSDPGVLLNAQAKYGTPPAFIKSSTVSLNQKEKKSLMLLGGEDLLKKPIKHHSSLRRKPLAALHSLPGGSTGLRSPLSGVLQSPPGLLPMLSSNEISRKTNLLKKNVTLSFLLQYTGGDGAKEGYYREVAEDLNVSVLPVLYFFNFSVFPVKG